MPLRTIRALTVLAVTAGALFAAAGAASAHADLVSTSPPDGAVLTAEPTRLTLTYSESVTLRLSSVSVVAPDGRHVASAAGLQYGTTGQDSLSIALAPDTSQGTYVVDWQAVAADDGHATAGFVTFSVGSRGRFTAPARAGARDELTDAAVDVAVWLGFAGLALLVGDATVRRLARPGRTDSPGTPPRNQPPDIPVESGSARVATAAPAVPALARQATPARRTAALGWVVLLVATLAQLVLAGPLARGESPAHALDRTLLSATLSTHEGRALLARLLLLALVAVFGETVRARAGGRLFAVLLSVLTLALAATWSATSHAASGSQVPLAFAVTTVHVAAMAVWAGGLAAMALLLRRGSGDAANENQNQAGPDPAAVSTRFSRLALLAVTALVASGLYQAWRELGGISALTDTRYGRLLLVKTGVVVLVLAGAARSRLLVARRRTLARDGGDLRTSVALELAGVVAVLVVTVLLIGSNPPRGARPDAAANASPACAVTRTRAPAERIQTGGREE